LWFPDGKGLLVLFNNRQTEGTQIGYLTYPKGELKRITKDTNSYNRLTMSRDGKTLATVMNENKFNLFRMAGQPAANEAPVQLTDNGTGPWTWLPDDSIAMAWEGRINRMAVDGGQATQMLAADEQHFVFGPALCGADHIAFN